MLKRIQSYTDNPALGLLALRLTVGIPFVYHGATKLMNMGATVAFFASINLPAWLAWLVAIIELVGGLLMIAGVATQTVAVLFVFIMVGAITKIKGGMGYGNGGYELDLVLLLASIGVICAGAVRYTLEKFVNKRK